MDREELGFKSLTVHGGFDLVCSSIVDRASLRIRYRLPLSPGLGTGPAREDRRALDHFQGRGRRRPGWRCRSRLRSSSRRSPSWYRTSDEGRSENNEGEASVIVYEEEDAARGAVLHVEISPGRHPLPSFVVPQTFARDGPQQRRRRTSATATGSSRTAASTVPTTKVPDGCRTRSTAGPPSTLTTIRRAGSYQARFPAETSAPSRSWSSLCTSSAAAPVDRHGLRGCSTAESFSRPCGRFGRRRARPYSAFHAAGPMKISGTGPATCGSAAGPSPAASRQIACSSLPPRTAMTSTDSMSIFWDRYLSHPVQ